MANLDAARYLCQWSRLARTIGGALPVLATPTGSASCRYFPFDRGKGKEQGLCVYTDPASGLAVHIPLVSGGGRAQSDSLAFPHMPGIMDWPATSLRPCFIPHLRIKGREITPSFTGRNVQVAMGNRGAFLFRYEQADLIDVAERTLPDLASWRVEWELTGGKMVGRFTLVARAAFAIESVRLVLPIATPHSRLNAHGARTLGGGYHLCEVLRDDFACAWSELETVTSNPAHRTCWGKIHYYQSLERDHSLQVRAGQSLSLEIAYQPEIVRI